MVPSQASPRLCCMQDLSCSESFNNKLLALYGTLVHWPNNVMLRFASNSFKLIAGQWRPAGRKVHPQGPDFKHWSTSEGIWIDRYKEPLWVDAQSCKPGILTMTNSFKRCGYVRKLCRAGQLKEALQILTQGGILADSKTYVCLLQECTKIKALAEGKQVHAHIIQSGFRADIFLQNTLINMHAKCGSIVDARLVFDNMPERSLITWNIMMAGYAKQGYCRDALKTYEQLMWEGVKPNQVTFLCVLKACASLAALEEGKDVHADITKAGIVPNIILDTSLMDMYAKCGSIEDAKRVFDNMAERDVVSWNAMIAGYAQHGCGMKALETYEQMMGEGVKPNQVTFISLCNACAGLAALEKGQEIHADIMKARFVPNIILDSALVDMYAKCGSIKDARGVFDNMAERNVVSWNAMIAGYAQHGCGMEALATYEQMMQEGMKPNQVTFVCVCNACASLAALEKGREIHIDIMQAGTVPNIILDSTLVDMYAKCGSINDAKGVFDKMAIRDVVSWNAMIAGYAQHGCGTKALEAYEQMMGEGVKPNQVTFVSVCNTCASLAALETGKDIHAAIIKAGIVPNIILHTSLIDMYAKCGSINDAKGVFDNMAKRDVVSWNVMIAGYAQNGLGMEGLEAYEQMMGEGVKPNQVTFVSICNACASLAVLENSKQIHNIILRAGIVPNIILSSTLVDMYAKCGSMEDAMGVFNNMAERDVVSWNAMIAGYAQHGCGMEAIEIYEQMTQQGVKPNQVTFSCICKVCASLAALEKGKEVHTDIMKAGILSDIILNNTLVDMYAKCGSIEEAKRIFDGMAERNVVSWSAIIAGYAQHGCGREVLKLFEGMQKEGLKPNNVTFICVLSACSNGGLVDEGRHYFDSLSQDHGLTPTVEHFGCMVDLLGRAGRLDEAEDFINKMPVEPDPVVWMALLGACRVHGNVEVAERVAKFCLKWDPQDAGTYVLLSNIYAAVGRWDDTAKVRKMMNVRGVRKEPGCCHIEVGNRVHTLVVDDKLHPQIEEIHAELTRLSQLMNEAVYVPYPGFILHNVEEQKELSICHHSEMLAIAFGLISSDPGKPLRVIKNLRVCGDCHMATKLVSKIVGRVIIVRDANRIHQFEDGVCSCGEYW